MKKVLIVTLAQGANYGGMLQAYALSRSLDVLGYSAQTTFSRGPYVRRAAKSIPGVKLIARIAKGNKKKNDDITLEYTYEFVLNRLNVVGFDQAFTEARLNRYHAYVSGSDQVWRKPYTYIPHNLLNFVKNDTTKVSYAASFGRDDLDEYGDKLIAKTKKLAQKFDAISVREDTGVDVAKKYWGVKAEHHVDPTLLLNAAEYEKLVKDETLELADSDGDLFAYVLDVAPEKQEVIGKVAKAMELRAFTVIDGDENGGKPMPPVTQWLKSFMDAKYVVTDSFHGTVFSIIFNKPFIAIGNKDRGLARFQSLLKMFNLQDRLVESVDDVTDELIKGGIDWGAVNKKVKAEQKRSMDYLRKYLK